MCQEDSQINHGQILYNNQWRSQDLTVEANSISLKEFDFPQMFLNNFGLPYSFKVILMMII